MGLSAQEADLAARAVAVLGDLAGAARRETVPELAVPLEWFRWLGLGAWQLVLARSDHPPPSTAPFGLLSVEDVAASYRIEHELAEELVKFEQLRQGERPVRLGLFWLAGKHRDAEGRVRRVFLPLVSLSLQVRAGRGGGAVSRAGDPRLTVLDGAGAGLDEYYRLLDDFTAATSVIATLPGMGGEVTLPAGILDKLPRVKAFARDASAALGLPVSGLVPAGEPPAAYLQQEGLAVAVGAALYVDRPAPPRSATADADLAAWRSGALDRPTAFHAVYLGTAVEPPRDDRAHRIDAGPFVLAPGQAAAVAASRTAPLTVVSGAPGNGKSHTVVAMATDAVARGGSVLIATRTNAAVDALMELFERAPGIDPVVFGSNERRLALADQLGAGVVAPRSASAVAATRARYDEAVQRRDALRAGIAARLDAERTLAGVGVGVGAERDAAARAPGFFAPGADLDRAGKLLHEAGASGGWWTRHKASGAADDLRRLARCTDPEETVDSLAAALAVARRTRAAEAVLARGGLSLDGEWRELLAADDRVHDEAAEWLATECRSADRLDHGRLGAVAGLATALRSGPAARRRQLARIDASLAEALPLWLGTLGDIEDLLPPRAAMFDLVILDEASCIDQPSAAGALLRASRAVVVGDPAQLRHTSFVSDVAIDAALGAHGLVDSPLASRLDVRRNSVFDVAAGAAPVVELDEHFRSAPHLVDFVADRVYGGRVRVATRSPGNEIEDCVRVVRVAGHRDDGKVVRAEIDAVVAELRRLLGTGARSVAVMSPFRAQADALEEAIRHRFSAVQITGLDLRVGTVHGLQGNERDLVLVSVGIGPEEGAGVWRFVEDPHLFTVLATRARRRQVLFVSADPPAGGLLADYLAQADRPPGRPTPVSTVSARARELAGEMDRGGIDALAGYPTGRHVVDVVVGDALGYVGIETDVHPDGAEAHIDRHLALQRAGWPLRDAFASRWAGREVELAVELQQQFGPTARRGTGADGPEAR